MCFTPNRVVFFSNQSLVHLRDLLFHFPQSKTTVPAAGKKTETSLVFSRVPKISKPLVVTKWSRLGGFWLWCSGGFGLRTAISSIRKTWWVSQKQSEKFHRFHPCFSWRLTWRHTKVSLQHFLEFFIPRPFASEWFHSNKNRVHIELVPWSFLVPLIPLIYHLYIANWVIICYLPPIKGTRNSYWVGGWTNPSEKYDRRIGKSFPNKGWK